MENLVKVSIKMISFALMMAVPALVNAMEPVEEQVLTEQTTPAAQPVLSFPQLQALPNNQLLELAVNLILETHRRAEHATGEEQTLLKNINQQYKVLAERIHQRGVELEKEGKLDEAQKYFEALKLMGSRAI